MISHETTNRDRPWEEPSGQPHDGINIASLLKELRDNIVMLFRQEIALARNELTANARHACRQLTAMAIGGGVAFAGAMVLLMGCASAAAVGLAALGVTAEIAVWLGPLLLGALILAIGLGILQAAKRRFQSGSLMPTRTVQTLKEDTTWAKEKLQRS
jgi:hypothetical protein